MRNKFAGPCYRCGETVKAGDGHFERHFGRWRTQHAHCAIVHRNAKHAADALKSTETTNG